MPQVLRDAFAACAVYLTMTPMNRGVVFGIVEGKVNEIVAQGWEGDKTVLEELAAVQALILVMIVQLFDGGKCYLCCCRVCRGCNGELEGSDGLCWCVDTSISRDDSLHSFLVSATERNSLKTSARDSFLHIDCTNCLPWIFSRRYSPKSPRRTARSHTG